MAKAKPKAKMYSAASGGGLTQVVDRRFETDWPIQFEVPQPEAATWMAYFTAEWHRRGWSSHGMQQLEPKENSGSLTLTIDAERGILLAVVWEWKKKGSIKVRARALAGSQTCLAVAQEVFDQATTRCRAGATERLYRRCFFYYDGLPWQGELWLDEFTRLGPPAVQYERAECGPRVVLLDAMIECVGPGDDAAIKRFTNEVAGFLSVVMGANVERRQSRQEWTWSIEEPECKVRAVDYFQKEHPTEMPAKGTVPPIPLVQVSRPELSPDYSRPHINERWMPDDVVELWQKLRAMPPDKRRDFVHAAAKWQEAAMHWRDRMTLSFALLVVACESLKPATADHRQNVYDVIEALFGKPKATELKQAAIAPETVRKAHLHRGVCRSSEFVYDLLVSTFDEVEFR